MVVCQCWVVGDWTGPLNGFYSSKNVQWLPTELFCYGDGVVNGRQRPAGVWCGWGFSLLRLPICIVYRGRRTRRVALVGLLTCYIPLSTISQPSVHPIQDVNTEVFKETHSPVSAMLVFSQCWSSVLGINCFLSVSVDGFEMCWAVLRLIKVRFVKQWVPVSVSGFPEYLRHSPGMLCCFSPCPPW